MVIVILWIPWPCGVHTRGCFPYWDWHSSFSVFSIFLAVLCTANYAKNVKFLSSTDFSFLGVYKGWWRTYRVWNRQSRNHNCRIWGRWFSTSCRSWCRRTFCYGHRKRLERAWSHCRGAATTWWSEGLTEPRPWTLVSMSMWLWSFAFSIQQSIGNSFHQALHIFWPEASFCKTAQP